MKTKRNLVLFIIIVLSSGWLGVLLDMFLPEQPEGDSLGMGLWLVAPVIAATVLRMISRDGKDMGLKPAFKGNGGWYVIALLIYPAVTLVTTGLAILFSAVELSGFTVTLLPAMTLAFLAGIVKNIFEEFAWRGYLTPKLMEQTKSDGTLYALSGLIWALWHAPYYLVFLSDRYFLNMSRISTLLIGIVIMGCWNVLFVEMYRMTKSIWPCVLMHALEDAIPTLLVTDGHLLFTRGGDPLFNPTTGVLATTLFLCIGLYIRSLRIKKEEPA